jgi:FkbM family methyltransferase
LIALEIARKIPATRRLLRNLGLRTTDALFGKRYVSIPVTPFPAKKLIFTNLDKNYLSFQLFWRGIYFHEPITAIILQHLCQPGTTFIDIGANVGFFSLLISKTCQNVRVFAFEPNPKNFNILQENVRANQFQSFCCQDCAISSRNGMAKLYLNDSDMSASLVSTFQREVNSRADWVEVRTVTLDSVFLANQIQDPVVVKIDVEGHEEALLQGAHECLRQHTPDLILEVLTSFSPRNTAFLKELGYRFFPITNQGFLESEELKLVHPNPFVFLNYLVSARPPAEINALFRHIHPQVQALHFHNTSNYFPPVQPKAD